MAETGFKHDVFISYSHKDEEWVVNTLLPSLEDAGLKVCIDFRDFVPGKPSRHNMRDACKESVYTVLVMTPAWMASEWTEFEGLLTLLHDPSGNRQRTIPVLLEKCDIPEDIQIFTYIDFTRRDREAMEWQRLLKACGTVGEFKLRRKKNKTLKDHKKKAQLILEGDYDDFDEKTLVAALAGMLNVDRNHIRVLQVGRGSIVIDLELSANAADLLVKMALAQNTQLRTMGIQSIQLEGQKLISVVDTKDWFLAHPYPMPPNFTGRVAERAMLTKWLNEDTENHLLVIRALGGFGKSALTWHWLTHDVDSKRWPKVIWWSFYEGDASFEHCIEATLKYLKLEVPQGQRPQVDELLKAMQSQKILLIMDGFERALRAYSSMNAPYQGDEEPKLEDNQLDCVNINAEIFLKNVCSLPNIKGKILMTTRLTPRAVKPRGEFLQGCREEKLEAMQKEDAVEFFRKQKIKGTHAEIEAACASYGYHPLSLRLLAGRILKDFENPADILVAQKLKIDGDVIQQKHHVLEVSYSSLPHHESKLLNTIACFRSPVELKTLQAVAENKDALDNELHDLAARGLLHFDEKNKKFDLHPIVRRYAYERLTAPDRTTTHTRLRDYFAAVDTSAKPQTLDDLTPVIELYHHTVKADELDKAVELLSNRLIPNPLYFQFGAYELCIELSLALFPDGEDKRPRMKDEASQAWTLNALANVYSLSGQPRRAIPLFEMQIAIREKEGAKQNIAIGLGNVASMAQIHIGALREAERNQRRRIDLCREIEDEFNEAIGHAELARSLSYSSNEKDSEQELEIALRSFENDNNFQGQSVTWSYRALLSLLMARESSLSKVEGRQSSIENRKSAIEYAVHALELADEYARTEVQTPRDYIRAYWLLGAAYRASGDLTKAEENLSKAISMCRQINMVDHEADILLDLARLRYDQKNYEEAKSLAEEALTITKRCGYVLQGADVNLFLAQYALEQEKDKAKAKGYAETALKLAYCDGPPYYYKVAYDEAERFLENLK